MVKKISIPYFPVGLRYSSPLILGIAIFLVYTNHGIWAFILTIIAASIWTTQYVTEVDAQKKECKDYLSWLFIPLNEEILSYQNAERIIITKGNYAQAVNTRSTSRRLDWSDYTATLLVDGGKDLNLLTRNSKTELIDGALIFASILEVPIEDLQTGQIYHAGRRGEQNAQS